MANPSGGGSQSGSNNIKILNREDLPDIGALNLSPFNPFNQSNQSNPPNPPGPPGPPDPPDPNGPNNPNNPNIPIDPSQIALPDDVSMALESGPYEYVDELRAMAEDMADEIKSRFTKRDQWEYEKMLGHGANGITVLMKNNSPFGRRYRRVVLKRALQPEDNNEPIKALIKEMQTLWYMRGHTHIAQLIDCVPDVYYTRSRAGKLAAFARRFLRVVENPPENIFKALSPLGGPALILEYLENGSLVAFQRKVLAEGIQVPNRVLWSWLYCLVRACVGMTYPNRTYGDGGGGLELETIQNPPAYHPLEHRDIAARNLMIANIEPDVGEHQLLPKLVMIDFGIAGMGVNPFYAEADNKYRCANAIVGLIMVDIQLSGTMREVNYNGIRTRAGMIFPDNDGVDPYPDLDRDLRDLLARSMNVIEAQRPELPELLEEARVGMNKSAAYYPGKANETDFSIRQLLQRILHDA